MSSCSTVLCTLGTKTPLPLPVGTDANVFVTLFGEKGSSGERQLTSSKMKNLFESGVYVCVYFVGNGVCVIESKCLAFGCIVGC